MSRTSLQPEPVWFVYIIQAMGTVGGELYTGVSTDVKARLRKHNDGKGAKYTRGRGPWLLLNYIAYPSKGDALRVEKKIKALTREQKLDWANGNNPPYDWDNRL